MHDQTSGATAGIVVQYATQGGNIITNGQVSIPHSMNEQDWLEAPRGTMNFSVNSSANYDMADQPPTGACRNLNPCGFPGATSEAASSASLTTSASGR